MSKDTLSRAILQKHKRTLDGELKMKASIIPSLVQSSHMASRSTSSIMRQTATFSYAFVRVQ